MRFNKLAIMCCAACFTAASAFAADDQLELDGNVKNNGMNDWEQVLIDGAGAIAISVDRETGMAGVIPDLPPKTIFWKGGSKDINDVTEWWYKDGAVPDKDDIRNGIAAAYRDSNDDLVFYFGADRYANSGDAIFGFWFFQADVGPNGSNRFTGEHTDGDLFIVMEYPQGSNAEPFVQVMEWLEGGGDVSDNLKLLYNSENDDMHSAKCDAADVAAEACAITNEDDSQMTIWDYMAKDGSTATYPHESFFEGRVNVSEILGDNIPCFSSFLIETRSSRSETAQLKDFIGGEFPLCSIMVTKTCKVERLALSSDNTAKTYVASFEATVTNDGSGAYDADFPLMLVDDAGTPMDLTDDVVIDQTVGYFNGGQGLPGGESFTYSGTFFTDDNPPMNTIEATVDFGSSTATDEYTIECSSLDLNPAIDLTKVCTSELVEDGGEVILSVDYDIVSCNLGDVPLDATITDATVDLLASYTLDIAQACELDTDCAVGSCDNGLCLEAPGLVNGDPVCAIISDTYRPSTLPTGNRLNSQNTVTVSAYSIFDVDEIEELTDEVTATCPLCPIQPEPQPE
ncbi:hypothetical protein GNT65_07930 [Shewanella sp. JBTF-M18]|uniref:DUF11 domain-containing protein n=1 Tax=Shewanella insulae TaxID=2681496 RepID=A0A6L7HX64_9GAMM|nr:hypothetical protein [Shewanella insulae]MXR68600.1 hypothetical protein [Shewanella insulae]